MCGTPEGNTLGEDIAAALATTGMEVMSTHFLPQRKPWLRDGQTWSMVCRGREVLSRTDYILVTDCHLIQNVSV